jgi:hypothetical protein
MMTNANRAKKNATSANSSSDEKPNIKTCFVIMPIADHPDYDDGHFLRVYEYIIKPACKKAGYEPIRADDTKASNMIMFDILKKIMECDMAICDLSSKNANVFYELGLRQAFNKKTILITDGRESAPFDIAAFRYVRYNPSLRVDSVLIDTNSISEMLVETEAAPTDDVNSIVKLLQIQPAHVDKLQLSQQESVVFEMFRTLNNRLSNLSNQINNSNKYKSGSVMSHLFNTPPKEKLTFWDVLKSDKENIHTYQYRNWDGMIGKYVGINEDNELVFKHGNSQFTYPNVELSWDNIFVES